MFAPYIELSAMANTRLKVLQIPNIFPSFRDADLFMAKMVCSILPAGRTAAS